MRVPFHTSVPLSEVVVKAAVDVHADEGTATYVQGAWK